MAVLELKDDEIRALQLKSLEIFHYLRDFCEKHGLMVYFCGGCCIGALRHKGFVPWDDDIDVMMPRADYERLAELWPQYADTERYSLVKTSRTMLTGDTLTKISDNTTTCVMSYQQDRDIPQGLTLDIIPLDGCPSDRGKRRVQKMWALVYALFCSQIIPEKHGGVMALGAKVLLGVFRGAGVRYRIWRFAEKQMTKYRIEDCELITELCSGPGYMQNEYPARAFAEVVYEEFEGQPEPLPVGYDEYLRMAFGDYMQMPPEDKRKPHHDVVFFDLERPYVEYKGDKYCAN